MKKHEIAKYPLLLVILVGVSIASHMAERLFVLFHESTDEGLLLSFAIFSFLCVLSFTIYHLSSNTLIPSFVIAIFFGVAAQPLFAPIIHERDVLGTIVGFGATLILFGGGLETPFQNFKRLFWKIFSLSFIGLVITAFLFSWSILWVGDIMGRHIPLSAAVLLGALLASTDPAAIIPILRSLRFKNRTTKDIIVSESALTDVTGTLLTVVFVSLLSAGVVSVDVARSYALLFTKTSAIVLAKQILFGVMLGAAGYLFLRFLGRLKERHQEEYEADAAFFLFVPVVVFTLAVLLGGSGYLAAFTAGLLFVISKHLHQTERFFNHTIEGFLKPSIFLLLGALVDARGLLEYAPTGIAAALIFMCIIRPISVFSSLLPFSFLGKERLSIRELLFISFVRETGAIPAVLLVTIVSMGIPGTEPLVPIGMWVILGTLILQPPLTPLVARVLKIAVPIEDTEPIKIHEDSADDQFVVLGSRGRSYIDRLPFVVSWASRHNIQRIVLLHCLEGKYTSELARSIGSQAEKHFASINDKRNAAGETPMIFQYISRTGFLQKNIEELLKTEEDHMSAVFVGRKVLDYRLNDIRNLRTPMFFID